MYICVFNSCKYLLAISKGPFQNFSITVREHDKYVAHVTCGHLQYVPSKFEENLR
jgi:hypothetical protein